MVSEIWLQDEKRPPNESGYLSSGRGDSGSPYQVSTKDEQEKERNVIVAVHIKDDDPPENVEYENEHFYNCPLIATKVSSDIAQWLRSVMTYDKLCKARDLEECQRGMNTYPH